MMAKTDSLSNAYHEGMERADADLIVALAEEGSLTAAAGRLHTAQPALSRRLARLERDLGVVLFERGRHGAQPTPAGRAVVDAAGRAVAALAEVEHTARRAAAGEEGVLRVGTTPTLGADALPAALAGFRAAHPDVRLSLTASGNSPELRAAVASGALDLAVAVVPAALEDGLVVARRAPQVFVAVVPADDPAVGAGALTHAGLARRPIVALARGEGLRVVLESVFAARGEEPAIAIEATEREMLIPFVAAGLGVTVVPRAFALQRSGTGTVVLPLKPAVQREVGVVLRRGRPDPLVAAFTALVAFD